MMLVNSETTCATGPIQRRVRCSVEPVWMDTMTARSDHCLTRPDDRHARDSAITDRALPVGSIVCHL